MKKGGMSLYIVGIILMILLGVFTAYSQEDIKTLADSAFGNRQRPAAVFLHDEHNEKTEIDECNVCHHLYESNVKVEDESSEDEECSSCHKVNTEDNVRPLMKAYHAQCTGCHREKKLGPVTCGECHSRKE